MSKAFVHSGEFKYSPQVSFFFKFLFNLNDFKIIYDSFWFLTGFTVDFESMKNQPRDETKSFTVKFDPQGVSLDLGYTSAILPIQVYTGLHLYMSTN